MADLATRFIDFNQGADLSLDGLLLAEDDGLLTSVLISLFTDRQARPDDVLPNAGTAGSTDRRGWWADEFNAEGADRIGSRLWLNESAKSLASVLLRDRQYAQEALQWLIDDSIASRVVVEASAPRPNVRALAIAIHRADQPVARYQFEQFWRSA